MSTKRRQYISKAVTGDRHVFDPDFTQYMLQLLYSGFNIFIGFYFYLMFRFAFFIPV